MPRFLFAPLAAAVCVLWSGGAGAQHVSLYTWYSEGRGDHFTTTDQAWAGDIGDRRAPGYRLIRIEGSVLNPEYPQPADTTPIYSFWNPSRQDNFLSSNPTWTGSVERNGYRRLRLEGYVYSQPHDGTIPLIGLWSGARTDNYSTTDPRLAIGMNENAGARTATIDGGNYRTFNIKGYMLPLPSSEDIKQSAHSANLESIGFGQWRPLQPHERGIRPDDPIMRAAARFKTKMVVVPLSFADVGFNLGDLARYGNLASPSNDLSLERGMNAISRGKFSWQSTMTPVVRDRITFAQSLKLDDAYRSFHRLRQTLPDDSSIDWTPEEFERRHGFSLSVFDLDGDGAKDDEVNKRTRVLKLADRFVRYNTFDANGDGRVDSSELVVLRFGADAGIGGQMAGASSYSGDGKTISVPVGMVAKDTTRAGLIHELLHVWGGTDVYGPQFALNFRNTIMSAMAGDDTVWELDPWHLQKFGWIRPRFVPIGSLSRQAGGSEVILAAGHDGNGQEAARPIIFYDPKRGLREYFIAQYRTPFPKCPGSSLPNSECGYYKDNGAPAIGFAIWHVVTKADGSLGDIRKGDSVGDRVAWPSGTADDGHLFYLGTVDPTDGKIGRTRYLKPGDGQLAPRWLDGTDTNLRLRAGLLSETSNFAVLQWRDMSRSFSPRLDILRVAGFPREEYPTVNAGQILAVDGVFGATSVGFGARIIAESGGERVASVTSWSPTRLIVEIPNDAAPGRYKLAVGQSSASLSSGWLSNGLKLQIPIGLVASRNLPRDFDRRFSGPQLTAPQLEAVQLDLSAREAPLVEPPTGAPIPTDRYEANEPPPDATALQHPFITAPVLQLKKLPASKGEKKDTENKTKKK